MSIDILGNEKIYDTTNFGSQKPSFGDAANAINQITARNNLLYLALNSYDINRLASVRGYLEYQALFQYKDISWGVRVPIIKMKW